MTRVRIHLISCLVIWTLILSANVYGQGIRISDNNQTRTPNIQPIPSSPAALNRTSASKQNTQTQYEEDAEAVEPSFTGEAADATETQSNAAQQFNAEDIGSPTIPAILSGRQSQPSLQPAPSIPAAPKLGPPQIQSEPVYGEQTTPNLKSTPDSENKGFVPAKQLSQPLADAPGSDFAAPAQPNTIDAAAQNQQPLLPQFPAIPRRQEVASTKQFNSFANQEPLKEAVNSEINGEATEQISLSANSPQVVVTTSGPKSVSINKAALYKVNVANVGPSPTGSVLLAVEIPGHVQLSDADHSAGTPEVEQGETSSRVLWTISSIQARSQETLVLKVVPRQPIPFDLGVEWTFVPFKDAARVQVTEPKLAMEISGPSEVKYGEKAIYTITLHNPGTGAAENVVVMLSDTLGGEQAGVGTVGPGDRKQFEVELIARDAGVIELGSTVKADGGLSVDAAKEITVRRGKLEIAAKAPQFKYAGSEVTYEVMITNVGDAVASNVIAAVALPGGAQYLGGIQGAALSEAGDGLRWQVGTLTPGAQRTFSFQCLLTTAGSAKLEVGTRADDELAATASATTKVDALADLTLTVKDPRGPQQVGEEVTYEIFVANRGTKEATNVKLVGQFSPGIEPTRTEGLNSKIIPGSVAFEVIPSIPVGQQVVVKVYAKAEVNGTHTFRAELNCNDQDIRRISEGTTKFFATPEGFPNDADRVSNGAAESGFSR